jgi:hypothetical protein
MHMSIRRTLSAFGALIAVLAIAAPALAHEERTVGAYDMEVGLIDEPVYTGQKSGLEFSVFQDAKPVEGLADTLKAQVTFQGLTRDLPITARAEQPGWYESVFFPTAAGPYTFHIYGTIKDAAVDEKFTSSPDGFGEVQNQAAGQFPIQYPATGDVARDAHQGASAAGAAMIGLVVGGAGLLVALVALGLAFAAQRRT